MQTVLPRRKATTTMEIVVAVALLSAAIGLVGNFVATVNAGLADRELATRLGLEIMNARERIGAWQLDEITQQNIEDLGVSEFIAERLPDAKWKASLDSISQPANAFQIHLKLTCTYRGQPTTPVELTFWVEREVGDD